MKKNFTQPASLGKRMLGYATSAGALALISTNASADIVHSGFQDIGVTGLSGSYLLDMDGDGTSDFNFIINGSYGSGYAVVVNPNTSYANSWIGAYSTLYSGSYLVSQPMPLGLGDAVDVSASFPGSWINTPVPYWDAALGVNFGSAPAGPFIGGTKFLGVRFISGGEQFYGWVRISLAPDASSMVIHDWAYESTPGAAITTDEAGPVATMTPDVYGRTNIQEVNVNISFDEPADLLELGDIAVINGTADALTEITPGLEYNLVVTAGVHGMVTVNLGAAAVVDQFGNESEEEVLQWFYDDRPPTVGFTNADGENTNMATQVVDIVFSEQVVGFVLGDIVVTNGTAANLVEVVASQEYTVEITATAEGTVSLELPDAAVEDYGANPNASTSLEWMYDITGPGVAVSIPEPVSGDAMQVVDINFGEEVEGFELTDVVVTNGAAANLVVITPGLDYTVEVTAAAEGEVIVEVPAAAVVDLAGNEGVANEASWMFDETAPVLTLESGVTGTTGDAMVTVSITASEEISGLELGDVTVTNGTAANLVEVSAGLEYTVDVTAAADGEVVVEVPLDAVADDAGNGNALVSTSWTYDAAPPVADLTSPVELTNADVTVEVSFDQEVTGLELTDFSVTNGTASNLVEVTAGLEYTVDVAATADGLVSVELTADAVADDAGLGNAVATASWTFDGTAPVAMVDAGDGATVNDETITVSITFDEEVEGFELTDISVTNGTASNLEEVSAGTSYTVDITATAEGEVTVEVGAGTATDEAGNEIAAASDSYTYEIMDGLDKHLSENVKLYPNPSAGSLHIELERESTIRVLTASGQQILVKDYVKNEVLDLSMLSQGVYIMQVENEAGIINQQFIIR